MKKIFIFFIVLTIGILGCSCNPATTEEASKTGNHTENQGITVSTQIHVVDFPNDKRMEAMEYIFPDGTRMLTLPGDAKTIFLVNGTYDLNIESSIVDDVFMVSIKDLCDSLDINATSENDNITITKDELKIIFKADDDAALVNDEKSTLEAVPTIIENKLYVPLSFICSELNLDADLFDPPVKNYLFRHNTVVAIDQKTNLTGLSEEEAYDYLKDKLGTAYSQFEDNFKKLYNPDSDRLFSSSAILKEDIDSLELIGSMSKYYVFRGPYTMFLNKYNKNVYVKVPTISTSDLKIINFNDEYLFENNYMVD
ncbi:MAG: copper amine oxidase N-terminal domain-containing protein [Parabacteroides sp.]|nr:copper amine oxidase N-terminal domain-containing protein [Parabacteroides sp.]